MSMMRLSGLTVLGVLIGALVVGVYSDPGVAGESTGSIVLEDFQSKDGEGFPRGWNAQRNTCQAKQTYTVQTEPDGAFLAAKGAEQRVYKKMAWDPKAMPTVTWRWRLRAVPDDANLLAAVYISLDTDLIFIPVSTKYVWSASRAKGTITQGGLFGATEIVLRTGTQPVGDWVEERVNAYEDFKRIHKHEPANEAWGISLLGGPGVEVDFGPLKVSAP